MKIQEREVNGVHIIAPEGKITLGDGDQELGEAVRQKLEQGGRKLVIDFTKVTTLDSSGLGELVGCYTSVKTRQGELRICGLNARIFNLMQMTSLHSVFLVKDTLDEALAGY